MPGWVGTDSRRGAVEELLIVVFIRDVVSDTSVGNGVCDLILSKISPAVGCGILVEFVEFPDCLAPPFRDRPKHTTVRYVYRREKGAWGGTNTSA